MNLAPIPLFGIGNQGKSPNVDAQSRTNLYIEVQQDAEKHVLTMYPTPGLSPFIDFGASPVRGVYEKGGISYQVNRNKLYTVLNDGTKTDIGTLATSEGKVYFADNGIQVMLIDATNGYIYNTNTLVFSTITSPGFLPSSSLAFMNGKFITVETGTGRFRTSKSYDGLVWDILDFATAEADPDNIVRLIAETGQLVIFGDRTTEFWGDSGALDFSFARIGSSAIEWGLAAKDSLAKFMDSLIFLRKNRLGGLQVCIQSGNSARPVSTHEMDFVFSQYQDFASATGFAYMVSGHPMYQISFPISNVSWLYDGQSNAWTKMASYGGRHRAELHFQLQGKSYVTDYENGKVYRIDENVYTDNGYPIVREFTSRHQANGNYTRIAQLWLEMEAGIGLQFGQGESPKVMMQISRDGGHEYGAEVWRDFGAVGTYKARAVFNRLGRARDWVFKFRVTDPVRTVFIAAWGRML